MMLTGLVHGHFDRAQCARLRLATAVLEVVGYTTESSTTVSVREEGKGMTSHMSVVPDTKSTRERYMRVAAIDILISEGS
jgi:hypothetical protein